MLRTRSSAKNASRLLLLAICFTLSPIGPDAQSEDVDAETVDRKLGAFCSLGMLVDRGLANTPFHGSTDDWLEKLAAATPQLRDSLGRCRTPDPDWFQIPAQTSRRSRKRDSLAYLFSGSPTRQKRLSEALGDPSSEKLPYLHLYGEGLLALCRPEMSFVFDDPSKQDSIREVYLSTFSEASLAYRAFFVEGGDLTGEVPGYVVVLRQDTVKADLRVLKMLSLSKKQRLWEVLSASLPLQPVIDGPGVTDIDF